jgi:probable phosphoglycerate mutase
VEDDLAEWDYGRYEGRTTAEIRMERPGWDLFRDGCPGGEQASDVAKRVETVLSRLAGRADLAGRTVVVFAHGHLLRVLGSVYAGFGAEGGRALAFDTGRLGVLGWLHEARALEGWNI